MIILVTLSHFLFRISTTDLLVVAGVLKNTVESSEETKVVREVTEVYVHEEFKYDTLINDIAILKVGIICKHEK
jgi:secreted trypsin-like serine protease